MHRESQKRFWPWMKSPNRMHATAFCGGVSTNENVCELVPVGIDRTAGTIVPWKDSKYVEIADEDVLVAVSTML